MFSMNKKQTLLGEFGFDRITPLEFFDMVDKWKTALAGRDGLIVYEGDYQIEAMSLYVLEDKTEEDLAKDLEEQEKERIKEEELALYYSLKEKYRMSY